jgi:transcriptional regulator with XRE-family HTH domain
LYAGGTGLKVSKKPNLLKARLILAANLRKARAQLGWSQEYLADMAGLHRTYVSSVERAERNISLDNIERLALALGRTIGELLAGEA